MISMCLLELTTIHLSCLLMSKFGFLYNLQQHQIDPLSINWINNAKSSSLHPHHSTKFFTSFIKVCTVRGFEMIVISLDSK